MVELADWGARQVGRQSREVTPVAAGVAAGVLARLLSMAAIRIRQTASIVTVVCLTDTALLITPIIVSVTLYCIIAFACCYCQAISHEHLVRRNNP